MDPCPPSFELPYLALQRLPPQQKLAIMPGTLTPRSDSSSVYDSPFQHTAYHSDSRKDMSHSQIAWLAGLSTNFDAPVGEQKYLRKVRVKSCAQRLNRVLLTATSQTSIIATIGPKTNTVPMLVALAGAGMNIGELGVRQSPPGAVCSWRVGLS